MGRDRRRGPRGADRRRPRRPPVRLSVDARDLVRDRRGIGRYARALVGRFLAVEDVATTLLVDAPFPPFVRRGFRAALGSDRFRLARDVPRDADVVWHPWNGTFFGAGTGRSPVPAVATIHDVVPFAFPSPDPERRESEQAPFRRSAAGSAAIVTGSAFSAAEISRHLGVPPERIAVVPYGVGPAFAPGPLDGLPGPLRGRRYVLAVATEEPHKNAAALLAGFAAAPTSDELVLATLGFRPPEGPRFVPLGRLSEAELVAAYRGALFVAAPGLYEGFGLPALEALACGTPVLAARAGALPEVCAGAAAYVDAPRDPAAWSAALAALAADPERRAALGSRGPGRAAALTWERTAAGTLAVLRAVAQAG